MKKPFFSLLLCSLVLSSHALFGQGSLTPPGFPAPTMKTLAQIEPRTDLMTVPSDANAQFVITQPGSYYLSANVYVTNKPAIQISTNNVSIDLNGFTIYCVAGNYSGIYNYSACDGIRIANGNLINWTRAVNFFALGTVTNAVFEHVQMTGNTNSSGYGIQTGEGAIITDCRFANFTGKAIFTGDNSLIQSCQIKGCVGGILTGSHSIVKDCLLRDNTGNYGIQTISYSLISNNEVLSSGTGIRCDSFSMVTDNNSNFGSGSGIYVAGSDNRIERNQVHRNSYGIQTAPSTTNFVAANFAHGNTNASYLFSTVIAGPTVQVVGTVTNHPWANFWY